MAKKTRAEIEAAIAATTDVEEKIRLSKELKAMKTARKYEAINVTESRYTLVPAGSTDVAVKRKKKEMRKAARRKRRAEEYVSDVMGTPSYADIAVAAIVRGRAAIVKRFSPGALKSEKIDPSDAKRVQATRLARGAKQDLCQRNKVVAKEPDLEWVANPGKKDVPGIDGPGYCYKGKSKKAVCVQKQASRFSPTCGKGKQTRPRPR